jgi:hypothetical protein
MGKKLSVKTEVRRLSLRVLAISGMLVAASAIMASAASARSGVWRVSPGQTIQFTNMDINASDFDEAVLFINGNEGPLIGSNFGSQGRDVALPNFSVTNSTTKPEKVNVAVSDQTHPCQFSSFGPNAVATPTAFSISDGGGVCQSGIPPTLGSGNFNGHVSVG